MRRHQGGDVWDRNRMLLSPSGIVIIDGDGKAIGQIIYFLDKDVGVPVVFDGTTADHLYNFWNRTMDPLDTQWGEEPNYLCMPSSSEEGTKPKEKCYLRDCMCNDPMLKQVPCWRIFFRENLPSKGAEGHWLQDHDFKIGALRCFRMDDSELRELILESEISFQDIHISKMDDPGKPWKDKWVNNFVANNPHFFHKLSKQYFNPLGGNDDQKWMDDPAVDWEGLPLEVYEALLVWIDGRSLINLANTSTKMEEKAILEPMKFTQHNQNGHKWYVYCSHLNRSTMLKIWCSFDKQLSSFEGKKTKDIPDADSAEEFTFTWESVFRSYRHYWQLLVNGDVRVQGLSDFEVLLKGEILIIQKMTLEVGENDNYSLGRITRSGGGRILYNIIFPKPVEPIEGEGINYNTDNNLTVITDLGKIRCRHTASFCKLTSHFDLKLVHFPNSRFHDMGVRAPKLPSIDGVLIGFCDKCICTTPLQSGLTRKLPVPDPNEEEPTYAPMKPMIIDTQENIIVVWMNPSYLAFFALKPANVIEGKAFDMHMLYRLQAPQMRLIWHKVAQHRSDYLPVLREYKGRTPLLPDEAKKILMGDSSYIFPPTEDTYYGLALISPIYGIESLKPTESNTEPWTVAQSFKPEYYAMNGRSYVSSLRDWTCSGKGHGLYVFCNDKTVVVSWNGITWIFGSLNLPEEVASKTIHNVTHIEVIHDNGLLIAVNDNIVLTQLTVSTKEPALFKGVNLTEPELEVKPVRVLQLGLSSISMELTHVELNFDRGSPFLFVIAENKPVKIKFKEKDRKYSDSKWCWDDFSFQVKRYDFK